MEDLPWERAAPFGSMTISSCLLYEFINIGNMLVAPEFTCHTGLTFLHGFKYMRREGTQTNVTQVIDSEGDCLGQNVVSVSLSLSPTLSVSLSLSVFFCLSLSSLSLSVCLFFSLNRICLLSYLSLVVLSDSEQTGLQSGSGPDPAQL